MFDLLFTWCRTAIESVREGQIAARHQGSVRHDDDPRNRSVEACLSFGFQRRRMAGGERLRALAKSWGQGVNADVEALPEARNRS